MPLHVVPQLPQFVLLLSRCTHAPLQLVRGAVQAVLHVPEEQTLGDVQVVPHVPQFDGSVAVSTHLPPHSIDPTGQMQPVPPQS